MRALRIIRRDRERKLKLFADFSSSVDDSYLLSDDSYLAPVWSQLLTLFDPSRFKAVAYSVYPLLLKSESPYLTPLRLARYFEETEPTIDKLFYTNPARNNCKEFIATLYDFIDRGMLPAICIDPPYGITSATPGHNPSFDIRLGRILGSPPSQCNNAGARISEASSCPGPHRPDPPSE